MSQTSAFSMFGQGRPDGKNGKFNLDALLDFSHLWVSDVGFSISKSMNPFDRI